MRIFDKIRRLRSASIWGPGAVSSEDARLRTLLQQTIPRFYLALVLFGVLGALGGTPALRQTFGETYAYWWSIGVAATAVCCLIGDAWPERLWRLEVVGASILNSWIFLYIVALVAASLVPLDLGRLGVGAVLFASTELPWWRIKDLYRERKRNGWK